MEELIDKTNSVIALAIDSPIAQSMVISLDLPQKVRTKEFDKENEEPERHDKYVVVIHHVLDEANIAPMPECQSLLGCHAFQNSVLLSRGALGRIGWGACNIP